MKLLMMDMDGTLFNDRKEITSGNRLALAKLKNKGYVIGIATGRALFVMKEVLEKYHMENIVDYVIGYNGVEIWNRRNHQVDYTYRLSPEVICDIYSRIKHQPWNLVAYDESGRYVQIVDERAQKYASDNNQSCYLYDFEKGDRWWSKVSILPLGMRNFTEKEFVDMYKLSGHAYHGFETSPFSFEIVHAKVSKVEAIKRVCEMLGITLEDVIAFGDSGNDLSMLQCAGVGVAMANATSEIKEAADYVTKSNNEDGIAYFVEKYIEGGDIL